MEWLDQLPRRGVADYLSKNQIKIEFSSNKEKKQFLEGTIERITSLLDEGKIGSAIEQFTIGLYVDKEYFLILAKRQGIMRHSHYLGKRNSLKGIATHILKYKELFKLNAEEKEYLQSLVNFEIVYFEFQKVSREINREIFKLKDQDLAYSENLKIPLSKIKALLAVNEFCFLAESSTNRSSEDLTSFDFFSREEVSDAVSYILSKYNEVIGFQDRDLFLADVNYATHDSSINLITLACRYKAIKELEIDIEEYGYKCFVFDKNIIIKHNDENFEKSIEISNIQYQFQEMANMVYSHTENADTLMLFDMAEQFHKDFPELFRLKKEPFESYVLEIPQEFYVALLGKDKMAFFREELHILNKISRELLIPFESLEKYHVRPNLTFYEFLRLHRFFIIQYHFLSRKFHELIGKVDNKLIYRSLIPTIKKEDLISILKIFSDEEKVRTFLDIITWKSSDKSSYLDLQYKPLVEHNSFYQVSICIAGMSNLPRSVFVSENKIGNNIKIEQIGHHALIADILSGEFSKQFFKVFKEIPIKYETKSQNQSDIDFLAYKDGLVFIAECKDAIHPVDSFEMRTTFYHIRKAASQLSFIMEALSDQQFLEKLCNRLNLNSADIKHIQPVIVLSNNKLWGYNFNGFPVRNVREIKGFMHSGNWNYSSISEDGVMKFKLWSGDEFKVEDLINYCNKTGPHSTWFDACIEKHFKYGEKIFKRIFAVDFQKLTENMKSKYSYDMIPDPKIEEKYLQ